MTKWMGVRRNKSYDKRMNGIQEVLEEVDVLIDTHFFNQFFETKSSQFLKIRLKPRFN